MTVDRSVCLKIQRHFVTKRLRIASLWSSISVSSRQHKNINKTCFNRFHQVRPQHWSPLQRKLKWLVSLLFWAVFIYLFIRSSFWLAIWKDEILLVQTDVVHHLCDKRFAWWDILAPVDISASVVLSIWALLCDVYCLEDKIRVMEGLWPFAIICSD